MRADLELRLVHDGHCWIVNNDIIEARGITFRDLDDSLKHELQESHQYPPGKKLKVFMGFDFDTLPTWLRQYHSHYFNRFTDIQL